MYACLCIWGICDKQSTLEYITQFEFCYSWDVFKGVTAIKKHCECTMQHTVWGWPWPWNTCNSYIYTTIL